MDIKFKMGMNWGKAELNGFNHSTTIYWGTTYYVKGTVLGVEDTEGNKTDKVPSLIPLTSSKWGKKQKNNN